MSVLRLLFLLFFSPCVLFLSGCESAPSPFHVMSIRQQSESARLAAIKTEQINNEIQNNNAKLETILDSCATQNELIKNLKTDCETRAKKHGIK